MKRIPKPKFVKEYKDRVMKDGKWVAEEILKLIMEKEARCGDGTGRPIASHSLNCRCEEIDKEIQSLTPQKEEG